MSDILLCLHGFLGRGAQWENVASPLKAHGEVLSPDLPGHGANLGHNPNAPLTFDIIAQEILSILDTHNVSRLTLLGYSLGGRAALHFACRFPEHVAALILESSSPGISDPIERTRRLEEDRQRAATILNIGMKAFAKQWYQQPLFASLQHKPEILAKVQHAAAQNDPAWMAKVIYDLSPGQQAPLWDCLPTLSMPVLLIAGEQDNKYTNIMRQMATRIPRSHIEIVSGAGHNVHLEKPETFSAIVHTFLSQLRQESIG